MATLLTRQQDPTFTSPVHKPDKNFATGPYKDMRYIESMANAAQVTTTMASTAKNSFALAMSTGGDGPEDYVPHLSDFIARANGIK